MRQFPKLGVPLKGDKRSRIGVLRNIMICSVYSFPQLGSTFLGVPIATIVIFLGLYWVALFMNTTRSHPKAETHSRTGRV